MSDKISRSSERGGFMARHMSSSRNADASEVNSIVADWLTEYQNSKLESESSDEWKQNNLEYDLRSTDWILQKARSSEVYSQNLYAALCNNEFIKTELEDTPENVDRVLSDGYPRWSCSWRHAGGIIADMREEGDYIDWYCSGCGAGDYGDTDEEELTSEQLQRLEIAKQYVAESVITDEIYDDLTKLGWRVVDID